MASVLSHIVFIAWLLIRASHSFGHNVVKIHSDIITSAHHYFKSDCVSFIESRDFNIHCLIVRTQRRLSDDVIPTAVVNTASVIDNSHRLLTSCNRPIYTIFDDNDARATLKMLSDSNKLSERVWLLFLEGSSNLDEYFLNINIPFDCEFIVAAPLDSDGRIGLTEVYRVAEQSPLQKYSIDSFRPGHVISWPKLGFYDRRSDLNGTVLKMSVNGWGFAPLVNDTVSGFDEIILKIFEKHMNFKGDQVIPIDGEYGGLLPNGSWSGIMGEMVRREVDMSGVPLTLIPDRFQAVAFGLPYISEDVRVSIREPSPDASLYGLIAPFSRRLWLALLITALGLSVVLAYFYNVDGKQSFKDSLFQVLCAVFCQQGSEEILRTSSKRFLMFLVYLLGIVVLSSYSCFFISSLTTYTPKLPFTTLKGLLDDGSYSLGILNTGWIVGELRNAREPVHHELKLLQDRFIAPHPENVFTNFDEAVKHLCYPKFAFIIEVKTLEFVSVGCKVVSLSEYFSRKSTALAFPKNSPYIGVFNNEVLKLMSSGIIKKHYKDGYYKPLKLKDKPQISANFETVFPILLFGVAGTLASILVLVLEFFAQRM